MPLRHKDVKFRININQSITKDVSWKQSHGSTCQSNHMGNDVAQFCSYRRDRSI